MISMENQDKLYDAACLIASVKIAIPGVAAKAEQGGLIDQFEIDGLQKTLTLAFELIQDVK